MFFKYCDSRAAFFYRYSIKALKMTIFNYYCALIFILEEILNTGYVEFSLSRLQNIMCYV